MRFDRDSTQWPNLIQNFKHRVHDKISFSDTSLVLKIVY